MAGSLLPVPKQQFFNDIGIPLFAGKIYTYAAGTLTPKATYQDQALTVTNTNPVIANARGEVVMYGSGAYRVILKDAFENTIYDRDNITINDFSSANGSESIGNGGETVAQSFNALQLADYGALRAYVGPRKSVYVTGYLVSASPSGIAGTFVPDLSDTTSVDNGGTIIVSANNVRWKRQYTGGVDVRWWGAKFDNIADDTAAIQACINYAQPLQKQILLPTGTSKITAQLQVAFSLFGLNMVGQGPRLTSFNYAGIVPATAAAINIIGHSGATCGAVISGIGFDGNATSTGIVIAGQDGQRVLNCRFGLNFFGGVFRNNAAGSFTEYCVFEDCTFNSACSSAIWYNVVGAGDVSFHGSGLFHCKIETPAVAGYRCIVVDPNALPYNSLMDTQVWSNAEGTFISSPTRTINATPYFVGNITTEAFVGPLTLANSPVGREIALAGEVTGNTELVQMGSLFLVDAIIGNSSGGRQTVGGRVAKTQAMATGANSIIGIPSCIMEGAAFHMIHIRGPNYDYRHLVASFSNLTSTAAPILATFATFNSAGWGPASFSLDPTTSSLVITNAAWPASGVVATVETTQMGQSLYFPFFK